MNSWSKRVRTALMAVVITIATAWAFVALGETAPSMPYPIPVVRQYPGGAYEYYVTRGTVDGVIVCLERAGEATVKCVQRETSPSRTESNGDVYGARIIEMEFTAPRIKTNG